MKEAIDAIWFRFTGRTSRHSDLRPQPLGAHAFAEGTPRSLCGYIAFDNPRRGDVADGTEGKCIWCERVIAGTSVRRDAEVPPNRRVIQQ